MGESRRIKEEFERIFRKLFLARPSLAISVALILGPAAFLFFQCYYSPDVPFIFHHSKGSWIMYPAPVSAYSRAYTSVAHFSKEFAIDQNPVGQVFVHLNAFREVELYLNEFPVHDESPQGKNWKKGTSIRISQWLKPGINSIRAHVENPMGPALLWLKIEGLKEQIVTDETWRVSFASGPVVQAILADDTRINPDSLTVPTPFQSIHRKGTTILFIFGVSTGLWAVGRFLFRGRRMKILTWATFVGILMVWIYLFLAKMVKIGPKTGFDATDHLDYILFIMEKGAIPLATDGWSMFHPPLFYLLSIGFLEMLTPFYSLVRPFHLLKIVPFLCGLGNVWVSYTLGRLIFKEDPLRVLFVLVVAGILPMNIYMSAYIGNEPLHAFLVGCSLVMAVHIFRSSAVGFSHMIYLGLLLGLAMLTKITAWVILPVMFVFLAYKMIRIDRKIIREVTLKLGLLLLMIFAISGWCYVRNVIHFSRPFMINWYLPGLGWWQDPGFHTIQYYLGFGEPLRHPYFSSFRSFWDSIYSTFWGDGLIGGKALMIARPEVWNYDYMSTVYLLALPAVGVFMIGVYRAVQIALKDKERSSRLIMAFLILALYSIGFFILFSTLKIPIYSQPKAFYGLSAMGSISIIFALGLGKINQWMTSPRLLAVRAVLYGWFGTLIAAIYLSFGA